MAARFNEYPVGCFEASSDALGGVWANVFRVVTIAVSVVLTLRYLRKQGRKPLQKDFSFVLVRQKNNWSFAYIWVNTDRYQLLSL